MNKKVIVFATNNKNKLAEVRAILDGLYEVRSLKDIDCDVDIPETHATIEENAIEKAQYISEHYGYDCFADDTGLLVDALNGAPGVYSARYANISDDGSAVTEEEAKAWGGVPADTHDSEANMRKLLYKLKIANSNSAEGADGNVSANGNRSAQFQTVIALIQNGETHVFKGAVAGEIATEKHGEEGFGYDPVFFPYKEDPAEETPRTLLDRTFAEMTGSEKNAISHRGRAVAKLVSFLKSDK